MNSLRKLTLKEENLIAFLISKENLKIDLNWKNKVLAIEMDDGNMGSLKLYFDGKYVEKNGVVPSFVSDFEFKDIDDVDVVASLFLDENGKLYELDIWKVDFSKLLSIPEINLK